MDLPTPPKGKPVHLRRTTSEKKPPVERAIRQSPGFLFVYALCAKCESITKFVDRRSKSLKEHVYSSVLIVKFVRCDCAASYKSRSENFISFILIIYRLYVRV